MTAAADTRVCPGLPGHPEGPCPNPPADGDRYCASCRAEFDARVDDVDSYARDLMGGS